MTGLRVEGTVIAWAKHPGGDESAPSMRLHVGFPVEGAQHEAELVVCIDRGLLTDFSPGASIHLLADPADLSQVAVDRARNAVELPRSS